MDPENSNQNHILTSIGLKEVMVEKEDSSAFNRTKFQRYVPRDYHGSDREESDEVYRMGEIVLLHKDSGLRAMYLTSESYTGEEYSYRLMRLFIVTKDRGSITVTEADFKARKFWTVEGVVPFEEVIKEI